MFGKSWIIIAVIALVVAPALGQPREWSDDFSAVVTYNDTTFLGPCYGATVSTKYTVFEFITGDIFNERAVSGAGKLAFTNRAREGIGIGRVDLVIIGAANFGQGCPDVVGVPLDQSTEAFTSDDVCVYGGMIFDEFQIRSVSDGHTFGMKGPDNECGVANVDDDLDGTTDEVDECLASRPTTVNGGFGNGDGTGFQAGLDAAPGIAGIDDDGNGTTDDIGETRYPSSDDGDDTTHQIPWLMLNIDANTSSSIHLEIDLFLSHDQFNMRELVVATDNFLLQSNELGYGFYQAHVHYNWTFCASGTCYGAVLWTELDIANPDQTLGPIINTLHNGPDDNLVSLGFFQSNNPRQYTRHQLILGNDNFSDAFWVVSGDASQYPHFPSLNEDLDGDRDVDGNDFLTFSLCYNGALRPPQSGCANLDADLDGDADVDGFDFTTWSLCHNGSLKRPQPGCMPPILTACP